MEFILWYLEASKRHIDIKKKGTKRSLKETLANWAGALKSYCFSCLKPDKIFYLKGFDNVWIRKLAQLEAEDSEPDRNVLKASSPKLK